MIPRASAKSVGENLFRLPCSGELVGECLFVSRVKSQFFFLSPRCLKKRLLVPVEKHASWSVERYFVVLEYLSGGWKGIVANVYV
jgi:hypothetical protein